MTDRASLEYAQQLDSADPLARFAERFYKQPGTIYLDGNSLGLLSRDAEASLLNAIEQWKSLGIDGWLSADPPWYYMGEELGARSANLVGAQPDEVVAAGSTTVNLHALVSTFFQPDGSRKRIIAGDLDFPSDIYALQAQIRLKGGDPETDLIKVRSRDGRTMAEDDIIAAIDDTVALVLLPSVLYRSGQLLDMERITHLAHEHGALVGWDCCHSAGVIPHSFNDWNVDFAFWCNYKYLNAGPGSVASLYVNRQLFDKLPALPGWWGSNKDRQFDMEHQFEPAGSAGAWQIGTVSVISAAPLIGSLAITNEAGIQQIREKSLKLTRYLIDLVLESGLASSPYNYSIGSPLEDKRRGGHVAIEHEHGARIARALKKRGVIPDFRPPNVVRLAPVPLYTSFSDVWHAVQHLRSIVDEGEHLIGSDRREAVA